MRLCALSSREITLFAAFSISAAPSSSFANCSNASATPCDSEKDVIAKLAELNDKTYKAAQQLESHLKAIDKDDIKPASQSMAHVIIPDMERVRALVDGMETLTSSDFWPYPTYFDLLYSVK